MRKYFCLLLLCLASFITVMAQEKRELKNVQLKSGISITGYVKNTEDGSISLTTTDGDQLFYQAAEIKSVNSLDMQEKKSRHDGVTMKEKGFQLSVDAFGGGGDFTMIGLEVAPSYRINRSFLVGLGIGLYYSQDHPRNKDGSDVLLETFARYNILNRRVTPFIGLNLGVRTGVRSNEDFLIGLDAGCMFRNRRGGGPFAAFFCNHNDGYYAIGYKAGWTF